MNIIAITDDNLNIFIIEVNIEKIENNDILNVNLIKTFNIRNNEKEEKYNEINIINFSFDEKFLLVLINKSIFNIYDINSMKLVQSFNNIKDINYCLFTSNKNNCLFSSKSKILISNENFKVNEIYECSYEIKQLLFSKFYNLIIIIPKAKKNIKFFNKSTNNLEFNIEVNEDLLYANISKTDEGKYLIFNLSKNYAKIFLYDILTKKKRKKILWSYTKRK